MKTAILLKRGKLTDLNSEMTDTVIFSVKEGKVIGVQSEEVRTSDINNFTDWCLDNKVKNIYMRDVDLESRTTFDKLNIKIFSEEELKNDQLYNTLIF